MDDANEAKVAALIMMGDAPVDANIRDEIEITENNSITFPGSGLPDYGDKYDGVKTIKVNVHVPIYHFGSISISDNNVTIKASEQGLDGFDEVTVNVPTGGIIEPLTVTRNGTYNADDYGYDGFDPVNVNVKSIYDTLWKIDNPDIPTDGIELPDGTMVDGIQAFPIPSSTSDDPVNMKVKDQPQEYYSSDGKLQIQILTETNTSGTRTYPYAVITNLATGETFENHDAKNNHAAAFYVDSYWYVQSMQYNQSQRRVEISYRVTRKNAPGMTFSVDTTSPIKYDGTNTYYITSAN